MTDELVFKEKKLKGEDGYTVVSIRIDNYDLRKINEMVKLTGKSRNAIVVEFIEYGLEHSKIIRENDEPAGT